MHIKCVCDVCERELDYHIMLVVSYAAALRIGRKELLDAFCMLLGTSHLQCFGVGLLKKVIGCCEGRDTKKMFFV